MRQPPSRVTRRVCAWRCARTAELTCHEALFATISRAVMRSLANGSVSHPWPRLHHGRARPTAHTAQKPRWCLGSSLPIAHPGVGLRIVTIRCVLENAQPLGSCLGMAAGLGEAEPPHLSLQDPVQMPRASDIRRSHHLCFERPADQGSCSRVAPTSTGSKTFEGTADDGITSAGARSRHARGEPRRQSKRPHHCGGPIGADRLRQEMRQAVTPLRGTPGVFSMAVSINSISAQASSVSHIRTGISVSRHRGVIKANVGRSREFVNRT